MAWAAHTGGLAWPALALYLAGIFWTLFYDTIYAHQDKDDDALIGVKSTARLFGDNTRLWLRWFMILTVGLMGAAVVLAAGPQTNVLALVLALGGPWAMGWHMVWQVRDIDVDDAEICLRLFRANRNTGLLPVLFFAIALVLQLNLA